jgi:hypothetical protein
VPLAISDPKISEAYNVGGELGKKFTTVIDHFMVIHARKMGEGMYNTYYNLLSGIDFTVSPTAIDEVRAHSLIFKEEMDEYKSGMRAQCIAYLGKIWEAIMTLGVEQEMGDYIDSKLTEIYLDILARATDRAYELIRAIESMGS